MPEDVIAARCAARLSNPLDMGIATRHATNQSKSSVGLQDTEFNGKCDVLISQAEAYATWLEFNVLSSIAEFIFALRSKQQLRHLSELSA
jgi:hypothetical protein